MTNYSKHVSTKNTPQIEVIPGRESDMTKNSAGGFSFSVDKWTKLHRFLILGSEGGSYYASERKLTVNNSKNIQECLKEDGLRVIKETIEVSDAGRTPKNDPAIFVLALAFTYGDMPTKRAAKEALPKICRIGTHLFHFAEMVNELRGWGKGLRTAVANWYLDKDLKDLAYQVVKYQQRDKWSHNDLLRLSHPKTSDEQRNNIFKWITQPAYCDNCGFKMSWDFENKKNICKCGCSTVRDSVDYSKFLDTPAEIIWAMESAKTADKRTLINLISRYRLPAECIPTEYKTDKDVLISMLPNQPMTNLIRNLGNLSKNGVLVPGAFDNINLVVDKLTNEESLSKARVHPLSILVALNTYASGRGIRGNGEWTVVPAIIDALNDAFYKSFKYVEPTGKKYMLALDVSGSMTHPGIAGMPGITPRVGSAAMALVTQAVEKNSFVVGFYSGIGGSLYRNGLYSGGGITPIDISRCTKLDSVVNKISNLPFGGTDCALPMMYALEKNIDIDTFVVYTDSETWAGSIHPTQALKKYRAAINPNAKLIVVGMVANDFSIADPKDAGMLDLVGFDTNAPSIISAFSRGEF